MLIVVCSGMRLIVRIGNRVGLVLHARSGARRILLIGAYRRFSPRFALAAGGFLAGTAFLISGAEGGAGLVSWRAYVPSGAGRGASSCCCCCCCCLCGLGGCGDGLAVAGVCAGGDGRSVDAGRAATSRNGAGGSFGVAWIPVSSLAYLQYPS